MLILVIVGCGGRPSRRAAADDSTADTSESGPPPARAPEPTQPPPAAPEPAEYIVRGACPFECCKYGPNWSLLHGGVLRTAPNPDADSVASVADGATVETDEGAMVLHPPGIAVVVPDTSNHSALAAGDTVEVITYTGAKLARVRRNNQEAELGWGALHLIREPLQRWWVHMTDPASGASGWLQMGGISAENVGAANACSGKAPARP